MLFEELDWLEVDAEEFVTTEKQKFESFQLPVNKILANLRER
jgi:hypothetical protein